MDIEQQLRESGIDFIYQKVDGTSRRARGTLWEELVPEKEHIGLKAAGMNQVGKIVYWDLDRKGFRTFDPSTVRRDDITTLPK